MKKLPQMRNGTYKKYSFYKMIPKHNQIHNIKLN